MIPSSLPMDVHCVSSILLSRGRQVRLAEIQTVEFGMEVLADLSAAILGIEAKIEAADRADPNTPAMVRRAAKALKIKRRQRPLVEYRLGEIRRAERAARAAANPPLIEQLSDKRQRAFVDAAREALGERAFQEIWAKARELRPEAWVPAGGDR